MENARETIAKIEETLSTSIPEAALKRDLNKMVLALTESVKNLVEVAKDMADALDGVTKGDLIVGGDIHAGGNMVAYSEKVKKAPAKKSAAKKASAKSGEKAAPKRTHKTPIQPK